MQPLSTPITIIFKAAVSEGAGNSKLDYSLNLVRKVTGDEFAFLCVPVFLLEGTFRNVFGTLWNLFGHLCFVIGPL